MRFTAAIVARVAVVAEVEVDMKTGKVRGRKFTVAHDCGIVINPQLLTQTIEGNVAQALALLPTVASVDKPSAVPAELVARSGRPTLRLEDGNVSLMPAGAREP